MTSLHKILDYGCGPGLLADYLSVKNIRLTGADINKCFIQQARRRHAECQFIQLTTDTNANKEILDTQLNGNKFDFIILLSITQYFKNTAELGKVVNVLATYLKDDGKIILADVIDRNTSAFKDAFSLLFQSLKNGKISSFLKFMFYLLFSDYRKLSRDIELLSLSDESIGKISHLHSLNYEKIHGLTIHLSRVNYILSKRTQPNDNVFL